MGILVRPGLNEGRLSHEPQGDGLLDIAGQKRILQGLHHAVEIAGDVVLHVDHIHIAVGDVLDERQIGASVSSLTGSVFSSSES